MPGTRLYLPIEAGGRDFDTSLGFSPRPAQLTDTQIGLHYADLWTAANSPLLDAVFQHIAFQEQRIKELTK